MNEFMKLIEFAKNIATFLGIKIPKLECDENAELDMTSEYIPYEDKIVLREVLGSTESYFTIAHELRHKWQFEKEYEIYFEEYKEIENINGKEYREQKAEIDADAFGMVMLIKYFGGTVCFDGYSRKEKKERIKRAKELAERYHIDFPFKKYCKFLGIWDISPFKTPRGAFSILYSINVIKQFIFALKSTVNAAFWLVKSATMPEFKKKVVVYPLGKVVLYCYNK